MIAAPFVAAALLQADMPPGVVEVATAFFAMIAAISLGIPLIRALTKRWERGALMPSPTSPEVTARLERIEQSIDAVAIEIERLAESQRFVARLMAEQKQRSVGSGDSAGGGSARGESPAS